MMLKVLKDILKQNSGFHPAKARARAHSKTE
jgi:hypothetical protein